LKEMARKLTKAWYPIIVGFIILISGVVIALIQYPNFWTGLWIVVIGAFIILIMTRWISLSYGMIKEHRKGRVYVGCPNCGAWVDPEEIEEGFRKCPFCSYVGPLK